MIYPTHFNLYPKNGTFHLTTLAATGTPTTRTLFRQPYSPKNPEKVSLSGFFNFKRASRQKATLEAYSLAFYLRGNLVRIPLA